jgi:peptidoglycan-N-acetylmuramic acid deacetylase
MRFFSLNRFWAGAASVVFLVALFFSVRHLPLAVQTGSWGLHFGADGETPTGNASAASLRAYDAAFVGDTTEKVLYLTFDAGYENGYTEQILDTLQAHDVPAAFFLVGNYLEQNPELVQRMVDDGHIVGNHTWHHYDMSKIADPTVFQEELRSMEDKFTEITGEEMPHYYRPPQGCYSEENLRMAQALGYRTVFWSLAYVDWYNDDQPTREEALEKLLPRTHPGAVILLHSSSRTNAEILDELLCCWEEMGYSFASLDTLFDN